MFFQELLSGQGEAIIQKGIELSLQGDTRALSICWDRLLPSQKERAIELTLPRVTDVQSVSAALTSVVTAVGEGRITPGEAECLAHVLETQMRVVEFEALEKRVAELEKVHSPTRQTTEPADDSTLEWISRNYSHQTADSGTTAEEYPEHQDGHTTDTQESTPAAPDSSQSPIRNHEVTP
jgi:hypothetical protein